MKISINERSAEIIQGRRQKMTVVARLSVVAIVLNLIVACNSGEDSSADIATFSQSIPRQFFVDGSLDCFDNTGKLDAAIYVYIDNPTRPDDIDNFSPNPIIVAPLIDSDNTGRRYTFTLSFTEDGNYGVAVVCNVSSDSPSSSEQLTYLSNRRYKVVFKDTVGLINDYNKPDSHLLHTGAEGCSPCHIESAGYDFLVTTVVHDLLSATYVDDCTVCHDAAGSATGKPVGHIITTEFCGICHVDNKWIDAVVP